MLRLEWTTGDGGAFPMPLEVEIDGAVAGYDAGGDAAARAAWPLDGGAYAPLIRVEASARFSLYGYGAIDGRGHAWWWAFLLGELKSKRPLAVSIESSSRARSSTAGLTMSARSSSFDAK